MELLGHKWKVAKSSSFFRRTYRTGTFCWSGFVVMCALSLNGCGNIQQRKLKDDELPDALQIAGLPSVGDADRMSILESFQEYPF